ncbi:type III secretion effector protein [Pseudomonas sp. FP597]|uniref:type III secretion effector protein n=1 Tax=Pseudomonas sp. FP597 TaxID=2954096 RepID=UPI0027347ABC|nr:type III secretion effector protein [Pseudomonas sp. FP597]WLI07467.1 type III secretion effector protein [Pseudomonas sp. FP597]
MSGPVSYSPYTPPSYYGGIGDNNEDLKQERKLEARESLKEGIEAFRISEQKKNIDAIR